MKEWITVDRLSCEIERSEGIFGILNDRKGNDVDFDAVSELQDVYYNLWSRSSNAKTTLTHWKKLRLSKILDLNRYDFTTFDPKTGDELCDSNEMEVVRGYFIRGYQRVFWPQTQPIFFKFECPEEGVVYRLKEELLRKEYIANENVEKGGWFSCPKFEIRGKLPKARIFPWEYLEFVSAMKKRAKIFSSKVTVSGFAGDLP
ncbi:MAG: hypothetical protein ACSHYA_04405 [Opitutaceae bacterium]